MPTPFSFAPLIESHNRFRVVVRSASGHVEMTGSTGSREVALRNALLDLLALGKGAKASIIDEVTGGMEVVA